MFCRNHQIIWMRTTGRNTNSICHLETPTKRKRENGNVSWSVRSHQLVHRHHDTHTKTIYEDAWSKIHRTVGREERNRHRKRLIYCHEEIYDLNLKGKYRGLVHLSYCRITMTNLQMINQCCLKWRSRSKRRLLKIRAMYWETSCMKDMLLTVCGRIIIRTMTICQSCM